MTEMDTKDRIIQELRDQKKELEERLKTHENREYKSRLFGFIFGREENKEWTLALYNAVNGTSHKNPDDITINTIEDVVYLGMKNDLSLLVSENVTMYRSLRVFEQQSTINPNMPIREYMYSGKLYDKFIYSAKLHRYGRKLMPLPIPKLVVFYNGEDPQEDEVMLRLSDAFKEEIRRGLQSNQPDLPKSKFEAEVERVYKEADPDVEVKVRMININYGHNRELLESCKPLEEYAWFVAKVRENNQPDKDESRPGIENAINRTIDEMTNDFLIKDFLVAHRAEVMDMCLTEYNETETMEMFREEGREEGRKEGHEEGLKEGRQEGEKSSTIEHIRDVMDSFGVSLERAMESLKIPNEQQAMYKELI